MRRAALLALVLAAAATARAQELSVSPDGPTGLLRLPVARALPKGVPAFALSGNFYRWSDFLVPAASSTTYGGAAAVAWGLADGVELAWQGRWGRSELVARDTGVRLAAGSLGDQRFALKLGRAFGPAHAAVVGVLDVPAPPADRSLTDGIGGGGDLVLGLDVELGGRVLALHALGGYRRERSGNLLSASPSPFEAWALDLSRWDRVRAGAAAELVFAGPAIFAEWLLEQPLLPPRHETGPAMRLGLGTRLPLARRVHLTTGVEVALASRFVREGSPAAPPEGVPAVSPYLFRLALSYGALPASAEEIAQREAQDRRERALAARRRAEALHARELAIEKNRKDREAAIAADEAAREAARRAQQAEGARRAAATGFVRGTIVGSRGAPISAVVTVTQADGTRKKFSFDGPYELLLPPGTHHLEVGTEGFLARSTRVDVIAGQTLALDFRLEPEQGDGVRIAGDRILTGSAIPFVDGTDELAPEAKAVLDEIALLLFERAGVHVRIEVHVDPLRDASYDKDLSELRAAAVTVYLTERGIESHRLDFRGHGSSMPLEAGSATGNTRVEFVVTRK